MYSIEAGELGEKLVGARGWSGGAVFWLPECLGEVGCVLWESGPTLVLKSGQHVFSEVGFGTVCAWVWCLLQSAREAVC